MEHLYLLPFGDMGDYSSQFACTLVFCAKIVFSGAEI
jgi:hypothetical protein